MKVGEQARPAAVLRCGCQRNANRDCLSTCYGDEPNHHIFQHHLRELRGFTTARFSRQYDDLVVVNELQNFRPALVTWQPLPLTQHGLVSVAT